MARRKQPYTVGDWIVHHLYGVGQIKKQEKKRLSQEKTLCYRVKTNDSTFWVPVENADNQRIRPITSNSALRKALRQLRRAPNVMPANHKKRESRIKQVKVKGTLTSICSLVRDLSARERQKSLNTTERRALDFFKGLLLSEWSICAEISLEDARQELQKYLNEGLAKVPAERA